MGGNQFKRYEYISKKMIFPLECIKGSDSPAPPCTAAAAIWCNTDAALRWTDEEEGVGKRLALYHIAEGPDRGAEGLSDSVANQTAQLTGTHTQFLMEANADGYRHRNIKCIFNAQR